MAATIGFSKDDLQQETNGDWKGLASTERCWRCGGLMVIEHCFDFLDDTGHLDFPAQRCVQCGELVDPVILMNRRRLLGNLRKSKKGSKRSVC